MSGLSEELVQALRDRASRTPGIEFLDDLVIETIVAQVGERFISDCDARWWWTEVKGTTQEVLYDDAGRTYVDALRDVIRDQAESLTMVVTDDEFPPWVGIRGDLDTLLGLLQDLWAFEYFLVDDACSWVVFDTHHNSLVCTGELGLSGA